MSRTACGLWIAAGIAACAPPAAVSDRALAPLLERASSVRGLSFTEPVRLRLLQPSAVVERLEAELDQAIEPAELAADQRLKVLIGLLPPRTDLRQALLDWQAEAVVGFYTPVGQTLYLVARGESWLGSGIPESDAVVLLHELGHALQDMHSQLPEVTLGLVDDDDLAFALGALLEGDATWTALRDAAPDSSSAQAAEVFTAELVAIEAEAEARGTPRWLRATLIGQYEAGYRLVERIVAERGRVGLDAALADPPLRSQEILHPERYLGERPPLSIPALEVALAAQRPDCRIAAANRFGELGAQVWALEAGASLPSAEAAAEGMAGDRAVHLFCPEGEAFAWLLVFEAEGEAQEFAELARALVRPAERRRVGGAPQIAVAGSRVLLSGGLAGSVAHRLLATTRLEPVPDLEAYLRARPQVLARAHRLRQAAR